MPLFCTNGVSCRIAVDGLGRLLNQASVDERLVWALSISGHAVQVCMMLEHAQDICIMLNIMNAYARAWWMHEHDVMLDSMLIKLLMNHNNSENQHSAVVLDCTQNFSLKNEISLWKVTGYFKMYSPLKSDWTYDPPHCFFKIFLSLEFSLWKSVWT